MHEFVVAHHPFIDAVVEYETFGLFQEFAFVFVGVGDGQVTGFAHHLLQACVVIRVGGEGAVVMTGLASFLLGNLGIEQFLVL